MVEDGRFRNLDMHTDLLKGGYLGNKETLFMKIVTGMMREAGDAVPQCRYDPNCAGRPLLRFDEHLAGRARVPWRVTGQPG